MPDSPAVMLERSTITFDAPFMLAVGLALGLTTVIVAMARRASAPVSTFVLVALGLIALGVAAGGPGWRHGASGSVAVMIDVSSSTRGATYRDEAMLRARLAELLGDRPHAVIRFGEGVDRTSPPIPPVATAVLLFSDGRFASPPTAPAVYAVIDPALEQAGDGAVTSIAQRGDRLVVTTTNDRPPRAMRVTGVMATTRPAAPTGTRTLSFPAEPGAKAHAARLATADRWPENDELSIIVPPTNDERWWIGGNAPGPAWRAFDGTPTDPRAYLAPSIIVLDNVSGTLLSDSQTQRLHQYVRDLGGGLLILGGDKAFAAGGYDGSILGAMSPLASTPPTPTAHWTFLLDASGSMAGESDGRTRLAAAVGAARDAATHLPPNDLLSVGGFSDELRWWTRGKPAKDLSLTNVPAPRGPTNLERALRSVADSLDKGFANPIVLMTDGQVQLLAVDEIATSLAAAEAKVHVFAIGTGPGTPALRRLAAATGGTYAEEREAAQWAAGLRSVLRQATPQHWMTTPVDVRFTDLPSVTAPAWNRTWLKAGAEERARTTGDEPVVMSAVTNVGSGRVAAVAFRPPDLHVEALVKRIASPPRDPRLNVTWRADRQLVVDLDAADETSPINDLSPMLVLSTPEGASQPFPVPQTGPGRYGLSLPAPRASTFATLMESGRVVDRFVVAGRYAAEFDGIGNDRSALSALAERTGGRVIEPEDRTPLRLRDAGRARPIASFVAAAGGVLIGLGLVAWRMAR